MLYLIPMYLFGLFYLFYEFYKYQLYLQKSTEEISIEDVIILDIKDSELVTHVETYINNNNINTNQKIIVCVTWDRQSIALLYALSEFFDDIHIFNYNIKPSNNSMNDFILDNDGFKYHIYTMNSDKIKKDNIINDERYELLHILSNELNTDVIFEAHVSENISNNILDRIFSDNIDLSKDNITHKPFYTLSIEDINNFIESYNLEDDVNNTHYYNTLIKPKSCFNELDSFFKSYYPNWRENLINFHNLTSSDFAIDCTDTIKDNIIKGDDGFILPYSVKNTLPYNMYNVIIDQLCNEYNVTITQYEKELCYESDEFDIGNFYNCNGEYLLYMNNMLCSKINNFINNIKNYELTNGKYVADIVSNSPDPIIKKDFESYNDKKQELLNGLLYFEYMDGMIISSSIPESFVVS